MSQSFCTQCGASLAPGQRFCTSCGAVCDAGASPAAPSGAALQTAYPVGSQAVAPMGAPQKKGFFRKLKEQFGGSNAQPVVQVYPQSAPQQMPPQPQAYQPQPTAYNTGGEASGSWGAVSSNSAAGFDVNDYETVYQPDYGVDDDATTVFEEPHAYVLVRESTGEQLPLTFPAVLGKGSAATCLITGNPKISRTHATLDLRDGQLFLSDMGSTNHTKVDGSDLAPNTPVQLAFGQTFCLCDEAFSVQELFG